MKAIRLTNNPIIHPGMDDRMCEHGHANINGPSLIRVPAWLPNPLGRYYLYFAHHGGTYIRMAYADDLAGPWKVYTPGTLTMAQTCFAGHIASPDVHVDHANQRLLMYYHGAGGYVAPPGIGQATMLAMSDDGLNWTSGDECLGASYFRVFRIGSWTYALAAGGLLYRSADGLSDFVARRGQKLDPSGRHWAVRVADGRIHLFYSRWGDQPEHLLHAAIDADEDWKNWQLITRQSLLKPEYDWEGVDQPIRVSRMGVSRVPVHELRDPAIYEEDDQMYLLYAVAGEQGIAIAKLYDDA